jgi:hypothetical protein
MTPEDKIKELENTIVHYAAREEHLIDMLQRIAEITEEKDTYYDND